MTERAGRWNVVTSYDPINTQNPKLLGQSIVSYSISIATISLLSNTLFRISIQWPTKKSIGVSSVFVSIDVTEFTTLGYVLIKLKFQRFLIWKSICKCHV